MDIINIHRDLIRFFKDHKIPISAEHKRYLKRTRRKLVRLYPTKQDQEKLDLYSDLILALFLLDLEVLRPQLQAFYSAKPRGTPPRDPIQMFRSLLCLTLSGETLSFTKWVDKLRSQPLFATLSGFVDRTPGIGTFYDFAARLYPEPSDPIIRKALSKPKNEKEPNQYRAPRWALFSNWSKSPRPQRSTAHALPRTGAQLAAQAGRLTLTEALATFFLRSH